MGGRQNSSEDLFFYFQVTKKFCLIIFIGEGEHVLDN